MDKKDCEWLLHKPVAWTDPDEGGSIVGVCGCGRFVWQATARAGLSRAAKREIVLRHHPGGVA